MRLDIAQLEFIDKMLRDLVVWIEDKTGMEFTGTSLYRIGDTGVHGTLPVRGVDLRCRDASLGKNIEALVNGEWVYDPKRASKKCAYLHGKGSNLHLHLQVHPNTKKL